MIPTSKPVIYMSISMLISHCVDYYSFVASFEIRQMNLPAFNSTLVISLWLFWSFTFLSKFPRPITFYADSSWDLAQYMNRYVCVCGVTFSTMGLLTHNHGMSFHLFCLQQNVGSFDAWFLFCLFLLTKLIHFWVCFK